MARWFRWTVANSRLFVFALEFVREGFRQSLISLRLRERTGNGEIVVMHDGFAFESMQTSQVGRRGLGARKLHVDYCRTRA
jgi:hypothetical protein